MGIAKKPGQDEAIKLRAEGMLLTDIGCRLGVSVTTVKKWLNPAYADSVRLAGRKHDATKRVRVVPPPPMPYVMFLGFDRW